MFVNWADLLINFLEIKFLFLCKFLKFTFQTQRYIKCNPTTPFFFEAHELRRERARFSINKSGNDKAGANENGGRNYPKRNYSVEGLGSC